MHIFNIFTFALIFYLSFCTQSYGIVVGSDTTVARQRKPKFPSQDVDNTMLGFSVFENGIYLEDSKTTCTFDAFFPIAGIVELNGGSLHLAHDLKFKNPLQLHSGWIYGNGFAVEFPGSSSNVDIPVSLNNVKIFLQSDATITEDIMIKKSCVINCGGYALSIGDSGSITVANDSRLHFENGVIKGLKEDNIRCYDDTGVMTLDDVVWKQDDDFVFLYGGLIIKNDVVMTGKGSFAYQTSKTFTIASRSSLLLDSDFTFSYDPIRVASKILLEFQSDTSRLILDGATLHATVTGLQLTRGDLLVKRDSFLSSEVTSFGEQLIDEGIIFGSGVSENDVRCTILSGSILELSSGTLFYDNVNAGSLRMFNERSRLSIASGARLGLYQDITLGKGVLYFSNDTTFARYPEKVIGSLDIGGAVVTEVL